MNHMQISKRFQIFFLVLCAWIVKLNPFLSEKVSVAKKVSFILLSVHILNFL